MASAFDELFTEAGDVAEGALQRLMGLFGPTGGEIVHGIITALAEATAPAQPAAPAAPAQTTAPVGSESAFPQGD